MKMFLFIILSLSLNLLLLSPPAFADCDYKVNSPTDGDTFYGMTLRVVSPTSAKVERTRFRLKDVYAPERKEPRYAEAKKDLADLISGKIVEVKILPDRDPRGGLIVDVYLCTQDSALRTQNSGRIHVNEIMRSKGWTHFGKGAK